MRTQQLVTLRIPNTKVSKSIEIQDLSSTITNILEERTLYLIDPEKTEIFCDTFANQDIQSFKIKMKILRKDLSKVILMLYHKTQSNFMYNIIGFNQIKQKQKQFKIFGFIYILFVQPSKIYINIFPGISAFPYSFVITN